MNSQPRNHVAHQALLVMCDPSKINIPEREFVTAVMLYWRTAETTAWKSLLPDLRCGEETREYVAAVLIALWMPLLAEVRHSVERELLNLNHSERFHEALLVTMMLIKNGDHYPQYNDIMRSFQMSAPSRNVPIILRAIDRVESSPPVEILFGDLYDMKTEGN